MKKIDFKDNPIIAFLLSFLFPGIGMFYLKRWSKGFINIGILILLLILFSTMDTVPYFITVFIGIASGAWAYLEADALRKTS